LMKSSSLEVRAGLWSSLEQYTWFISSSVTDFTC
jgi:hypothetical protein